MRKLLFILGCILGCGLQAQTSIIQYCLPDSVSLWCGSVPYYILGNDVHLRKDSTLHAPALHSLPIGTEVFLLGSTQRAETRDGIQAPWYQVSYKGQTGWIWGGFLTPYAFRSVGVEDVFFVVGYDKSYFSLETRLEGEPQDTVWHSAAQIRAVKNGKEVDKICLDLWSPLVGAANLGNMGWNGVQDMLAVSMSGEACGYFYGSQYILWNGKFLCYGFQAGGVPDGMWGTEENVVFPWDMNGKYGQVTLLSGEWVPYEILQHLPEADDDEYYWYGYRVTPKVLKWDGQRFLEQQSNQLPYVTHYMNAEDEKEVTPAVFETLPKERPTGN